MSLYIAGTFSANLCTYKAGHCSQGVINNKIITLY